MIRIFTPSFADTENTNAQNLTVKEIVARLPDDRFHVTMIADGQADARIAGRRNTTLLPWRPSGNARRLLTRCLLDRPDVYFYPREGVLDYAFLRARRHLRLRTAVVTHVVKCVEPDAGTNGTTMADRALDAAIREASAVCGNSSYVSETVANRFHVEAPTIHNGIDARFFFPRDPQEHRAAPERLTVLYAGSLQARKRPAQVVRLAAEWPDVQFRLAGDGEERASCVALAESLGCGNVTMLGHLPPAELGLEMRQADLFLFPSLIEGHPQVLGQAAACGLPAVAMRAYHPDYVVHGRTGFLADNDDELTSALATLLTNTTLRVTMAELAASHAASFNWDDAVAKWQGVFEQVVNQPGSRSQRS